MLKFDNYCWLLRASKPNACQQTDNFCSKLTTFAVAICTGFSITSAKIAQMRTTVSAKRFHLLTTARSDSTQKQQTQVSEYML